MDLVELSRIPDVGPKKVRFIDGPLAGGEIGLPIEHPINSDYIHRTHQGKMHVYDLATGRYTGDTE